MSVEVPVGAARCTECACTVLAAADGCGRPMMDWVAREEASCRFPPWNQCPHFVEMLARYVREAR
jgi:hypothetical protein